MWTPAGELDVHLTYTYSSGADPALELVSGSAGSYWDPARRSGVDHVCYYTDDIVADSQRLVDAGYPVVVRLAEGARGFRYHQAPVEGLCIELLERTGKAPTDVWRAEGVAGS
jgi:hypothetical protein